jgi:hypothetical protein
MREWVDNMLAKQAHLIEIAHKLQTQKDAKHLSSTTLATEFLINSYVLIQYPDSAMGHKAPSKLHTPWRGPLRVVNFMGSTYTLQDLVTLKLEDVHVSRLKPFEYDADRVDPTEVALSDKQAFLIERVIAHRGNVQRKSSLEFKVKWQGYEDPTWEPWKNLRNTDQLHQYLKSKKQLKAIIPKHFR